MKIDVMAFTDTNDEPLRIANLEWPVVPRIGETLVLAGPQFGDAWALKHGQVGEGIFIVEDVVHRAMLLSSGEMVGRKHDVEVYVTWAQLERPGLSIRCTCEVPVHLDSEPARCDTCGHRISEGRRS